MAAVGQGEPWKAGGVPPYGRTDDASRGRQRAQSGQTGVDEGDDQAVDHVADDQAH